MSVQFQLVRTPDDKAVEEILKLIRSKYQAHLGKHGLLRIVLDTSWRNWKPTLKQLSWLVAHGVNPSESMNRGEASDIIAKLSGRYARARARGGELLGDSEGVGKMKVEGKKERRSECRKAKMM